MTPGPITRPSPTDGPLRLRMTGAMTVSLLVHAMIISLQFGAPGIGLPALELPWRERRAQAIELQVALAPPAGPAESAAPPPTLTAESMPPSGLRVVPLPPTPKAGKKAGAPRSAAARPPRARVKRETPVIALDETRDSRFNLPAPAADEVMASLEPEEAAPAPTATVSEEESTAREREQAALRQAEEDKAMLAREAEALAARQQQEEAARAHALAMEAQRIEAAKRREETERAALALEEQRKAEEASRQALALQQQREAALRREREEAARLQEERQRREAIELQARKEAEAAARERQAEELAARKKAEAEAASAPRREREPELALGDNPAPGSRLEALPRNIGGGLAGRALEQARRSDVLRNDVPSRQSENATDQPRRRSFLGGKDVDVGLMMYVESWRLKIERNGSVMYPRAAVDKAQGDPVVTVSVRSDGSVENVVIHRSSGRSELDEAVHRIVRMNARYSAFPPELARRFDVIEIRKVWNFDDRLRILEEVR